MTPYTYVIIRKDISPEQQIVQACHASLEAGMKLKNTIDISYLIVLEVPNEEKLLEDG